MSDIVDKLIELSTEKQLEVKDFDLLETSPTIEEDINKLCNALVDRKDVINLSNMVMIVSEREKSLSEILPKEIFEEIIDLFYNSHDDYKFGTLVLFSNVKVNFENDEDLGLDDDMIRYIINKYSSQTLLERYEEILKDSYPHIRPFTTCS